MIYRTPSDKEYRSYDGGHCKHLWHDLSEEWQCPGCNRSKREILRWRERNVNGNTFNGWIAPLCKHHDHSSLDRFHETVICGDCNSVDGAIKRKLRLPESWSFSPNEIRQFITPIANAKHTDKARSLKYKVAASIFDRSEGHYDLSWEISKTNEASKPYGTLAYLQERLNNDKKQGFEHYI